jgi:hypothetical protein
MRNKETKAKKSKVSNELEIKYLPKCEDEPELSKLIDKFDSHKLRDILTLSIEGDNIKIFKIIVKFVRKHPGTWKKSFKNYINSINSEIELHLYEVEELSKLEGAL